ncbi:HNH endonuclease [Bdellovibrio sp. HCB337]|uniref:HNH endonuclease n=1 Tax=Bdellovibrio sp. HCB337 TaxID=3394358 RepID=UPI0039A53C70
MGGVMHHLSSLRSLLLNSSYEPMRIVSWQKALILWFQDKVEILEYHTVFARSARTSYQMPSVLRLKSYVRPRSTGAVRFCRENVYIRDNFTCQYCGDKLVAKHLTLDHVVPASKNGKKTWTNVVSACRECNQRKANRTPQTANMPLLTEPKMPSWLPTRELEIQMEMEQAPASWLEYLRFKAG